jgi:hypothetical protein
MAGDEPRNRSRRNRIVYADAAGRTTEDPARAVTGEVVEQDSHGRPLRRTRFFLSRAELPWLPVGESAFLLWVLTALLLVWLGIGIALGLL